MMFAGGSWAMMLVLLLFNGGGRDLLDCLSVADYWQAKTVAVNVDNMILELGTVKDVPVGDITGLITDLGSDDYGTREAATKKIRTLGPGVVPQLKERGLTSNEPEAVDRSRKIINSFVRGGKAKEVRRLMAIRALGELKKAQAIPALTALLDSTDSFVAEYAQAAIASIQGKPFVRPTATAQQLKSDLYMLPAGLGAVGQRTLDGSQVGLIDLMVDQAGPGMGVPGWPGPNLQAGGGLAFKPRMQAMLSGHVIKLVEKIGNVRLDAVTMGVSKDIGDKAGFVVVIARGTYDPTTLHWLPNLGRAP